MLGRAFLLRRSFDLEVALPDEVIVRTIPCCDPQTGNWTETATGNWRSDEGRLPLVSRMLMINLESRVLASVYSWFDARRGGVIRRDDGKGSLRGGGWRLANA